MTTQKPSDDSRSQPERSAQRALSSWGASAEQVAAFEALGTTELIAGRLIAQLGPELVIDVGEQDVATMLARASGSMRDAAINALELPVVGDYLAVRRGVGDGHGRVEHVLPRRSLLRRRAAGSDAQAQAIAANVDVVFAVAALEQGFSVRRVERAVAIAHEAPARPVVVLTKADLCSDVKGHVHSVTRALPGVEVIVVGADQEAGVADVRACLSERQTGVLIGMSGAGKSTLTNRLLATERMATAAVREIDSRGRHTTTHREVLRTGWGAFLIDGPGVRELGVVDDDALAETFDDIAALASACRFSDCAHGNEPGCAVQHALETHALPQARFDAYQKLSREAAFVQSQSSAIERRARNARHRAVTTAAWEASRRKR